MIRSLEEFKKQLQEEHVRSKWGCLLAFRDDFLDWYQGGRLLDVGCNVGYLAELVGEENYYGLDIIEYDKKPKNFVVADVCRCIPFPSEYFDFISMIETLEHLYDPFCALMECKRVLKPRGRLFIQSVHGTDPCAEGDPTHFQSFLKWSLFRLLQFLFTDVDVELRGGTLIAKVVK